MITNFNDLSASLAQIQMSIKKESVKDELRLFDARYNFSRDVLGIGQTPQNFSIKNKKSKFVNFDEYDPDDHSNDPDVVAGSDRMRGYVENVKWQTEQEQKNKQRLNNELNAINDAANKLKTQQEQNIASRQAELDQAEEQLHQIENNLRDREDAVSKREAALSEQQRQMQEQNGVPERQYVRPPKTEDNQPIETNTLLEDDDLPIDSDGEQKGDKVEESAGEATSRDGKGGDRVEESAGDLAASVGSTEKATGLLARLTKFATDHGIPQTAIDSISNHKVGIGLGITATIVAIVALVKLLKKNKKINKSELKQVISGGQGVNNVTQVTETLNSANPNSQTAGITA